MDRTTLEGSCLCGAVKYEANGEAKRFTNRFLRHLRQPPAAPGCRRR